MSRRILVAGGAGFIGSHLCEHLLGRGDEVVCVDDLSTGAALNVGHLAGHRSFAFVEVDVTVEGWRRSWGAERFDAICHLASAASPSAYGARPLQTLAAGSEGTRQLLELAAEHGARFVLASTSEVYGDPEVHPQVESYRGNVDPVGPRSVYDEAKRFAEALTAAYGRSRGVDTAIARIFNTYGPRLAPGDGRVVSNFIFQALTRRPLTVFGDGRQTRSLCYVDDMVTGIAALLDSTAHGPVNLGNPDERTILELAHTVIGLTGSDSPVVHEPLPVDDPRRRCPDIEVARRLLRWEPSVSLADGLTRTIEHLRRSLSTSRSETGPPPVGGGDGPAS